MKIKTTIERARVPITIIEIDGNIDSSTYDTFLTHVEKTIANGTRYMLIDLTHSPFVSSAGLRSMHSILNQLRALEPDKRISDTEIRRRLATGAYKSPHLKLLNLSPETQTAFELSGFNLFIETFTDINTALESF